MPLYIGDQEIEEFIVGGDYILEGYVGTDQVWGGVSTRFLEVLVNLTNRVVVSVFKYPATPTRVITAAIYNGATNVYSHSQSFNSEGTPNDINLTSLVEADVFLRTSSAALNDIERVYLGGGDYGVTNVHLNIFSSLTRADIIGQYSLEEVSLQGLSLLDHLEISSCGLEIQPALEEVTALKILNLFSNSLVSLDISNNTILEELIVDYNQLMELDLSHTPLLKVLSASFNIIGEIDLTPVPDLDSLDLSANPIEDIDLSVVPILTSCALSETDLTEIDLQYNTILKTLYIRGTGISELNLENQPELLILDIANTPITTIDLEINADIYSLDISGCPITSLDIDHLDLINLRVGGSSLSSLDIEPFTNLIELAVNDCSFLTPSVIDEYIIQLDNNGKFAPPGGPYPVLLYSLNNFSGVQPTNSSRAAYESLISKGWTITGRPPLT